MIDPDLPPWRRRELLREWLEIRIDAINLADLLVVCGLKLLEVGQRVNRPRMAYRAQKHFVRAVGYYQEVGMGRRARAVSRLLERCRRAWLRHEAGEGWR